jgi:hypothetical protein
LKFDNYLEELEYKIGKRADYKAKIAEKGRVTRRKYKARADKEANTPEGWGKVKVGAVRSRAKKLGLPCDVDAAYLISIRVDECPIAKTPLDYEMRTDRPIERGNRASIDRIDNSLGYVKGNLVIVSDRVNRIKSDLSLAEMRLYYSRMINFYANRGGQI